MPKYRSSIFETRQMAGARSLWRATGKYETGKPIIAIANSFTQFVPGHVHLQNLGQLVADEIFKSGGIAKEFNTIAIDDGIAMGHDGMLYSLPSRELIADSVEYMVNAHCADALICISNCDKITPGMLMAAMRLNIPTIIISGGPMEAGKLVISDQEKALDLVDVLIAAGDDRVSDEDVAKYECAVCPTCGSCSGMFTANSMNCLSEALGLALPGNGTLLASHKKRKDLFLQAGREIVAITKRYYEQNDTAVLPRSVACKKAFENAIALDIAMGGSTNTVLHTLAIANEGAIDFTLDDFDRLSRKVPHLSKVSPSSNYHIEDVHRAGGIMAILGELDRMGLIHRDTAVVYGKTIGEVIDEYDVVRSKQHHDFYKAAPGGRKSIEAFSQDNYYKELDLDREHGCIRNKAHAYSQDGGLAVLFGNLSQEGCIVKTAGVDENILKFTGKAVVCESQEEAVEKILGKKIQAEDVVVIRYEGPKGGPGMQEMLYPTSYLKSVGLDKACALVTDGRFSGGSSGLSIGHVSPEAAEGGNIALIENGDEIVIDIPNRSINLNVSNDLLAKRRAAIKKFVPKHRDRKVAKSLQIYAAHVTNASKGAVREIKTQTI